MSYSKAQLCSVYIKRFKCMPLIKVFELYATNRIVLFVFVCPFYVNYSHTCGNFPEDLFYKEKIALWNLLLKVGAINIFVINSITFLFTYFTVSVLEQICYANIHTVTLSLCGHLVL